VVGLYLDPPEKALVLAVDEKSQNQALDRSAPVLPMMPGMPERRTHDYLRNGITTLFAALDVATGTVIGSIHRRHRAAEFKKFLTKLDKEVPADLDVHLVCDNYTTHKHQTIQRWLAAHPQFHMHFTPTYSSWLNQVDFQWRGFVATLVGQWNSTRARRHHEPGLSYQVETRRFLQCAARDHASRQPSAI
jgi:hypothetical protein